MSYQNLPSITECDLFLKKKNLAHGKVVREQVNIALDLVRKEISQKKSASILKSNTKILERVALHVRSHSQNIHRVINATGIVIHTNLGRAPLSEKLLAQVLPKMSSYSMLEYEIDSGKRGSRDSKIRRLLCSLSGAEDALVVNNNAAAVFLMLKALTSNYLAGELPEVILSRGELVEIGGSFRITDIIQEAGVKIVEIGSTNKCRLSDYEKAITEKTVALLKVHPSNYKINGFTESVSVEKISKLAHSRGIMCFHDWGSGSFYKFKQHALRKSFTVQQELAVGPDLLTFSGDKLLGSVQAGVILGKAEIVQKMRNHPIYRALRLDKVSIGLLETTLEAYLDLKSLPEVVPTVQLLELTGKEILENVKNFVKKLKFKENTSWKYKIVKTNSLTGGGALPESPLDSTALVLSHPNWSSKKLQEWLRSQPIPVIVRIHNEQIWLDFRTILPQDNTELLSTLSKLISE